MRGWPRIWCKRRWRRPTCAGTGSSWLTPLRMSGRAVVNQHGRHQGLVREDLPARRDHRLGRVFRAGDSVDAAELAQQRRLRVRRAGQAAQALRRRRGPAGSLTPGTPVRGRAYGSPSLHQQVPKVPAEIQAFATYMPVFTRSQMLVVPWEPVTVSPVVWHSTVTCADLPAMPT